MDAQPIPGRTEWATFIGKDIRDIDLEVRFLNQAAQRLRLDIHEFAVPLLSCPDEELAEICRRLLTLAQHTSDRFAEVYDAVLREKGVINV